MEDYFNSNKTINGFLLIFDCTLLLEVGCILFYNFEGKRRVMVETMGSDGIKIIGMLLVSMFFWLMSDAHTNEFGDHPCIFLLA